MSESEVQKGIAFANYCTTDYWLSGGSAGPLAASGGAPAHYMSAFMHKGNQVNAHKTVTTQPVEPRMTVMSSRNHLTRNGPGAIHFKSNGNLFEKSLVFSLTLGLA